MKKNQKGIEDSESKDARKVPNAETIRAINEARNNKYLEVIDNLDEFLENQGLFLLTEQTDRKEIVSEKSFKSDNSRT